MKRPYALVAATLLLVATHLYGIAEPFGLIRAGRLGVGPLLPSVILLAVYGLLFALIAMAWRGRNWARMLCAAAAVLALLASAPHLRSFGMLAIGWFVAKGIAVALLYAPSTNRWFRQSGPNNSSKPTPPRGAA